MINRGINNNFQVRYFHLIQVHDKIYYLILMKYQILDFSNHHNELHEPERIQTRSDLRRNETNQSDRSVPRGFRRPGPRR